MEDESFFDHLSEKVEEFVAEEIQVSFFTHADMNKHFNEVYLEFSILATGVIKSVFSIAVSLYDCDQSNV